MLAWRNTTAQVLRAVHGAGGWAWQMFTEAGPPEPTANVDSCIEQYVGFMLGLAVRFADGFMVGFVVGFAVCWPVGAAVGFAVPEKKLGKAGNIHMLVGWCRWWCWHL